MRMVFKCLLIVSLLTYSVSAELVHHWKMDDGSGLIATDSGSWNNEGAFMEADAAATTGQGPTWSTDAVLGGSLMFDGVTDWVATQSEGIQGGNPRTLAGWVKMTNEQFRHTILQWGYGPVASQYFRFVIENGRFRIEVAGGNALALNEGDLAINTWHHFAVCVDDFNGDGEVRTTEIKFYLNGNEVAQTAAADQLVNSTYVNDASLVHIGGAAVFNDSTNPREPLTGLLDDIRIYDEVLTPAQIQILANPLAAWNASPEPGAPNQGQLTGTKVNVQFSWNTGLIGDGSETPNPDINKHLFYLNDDPNFVDITPVEITAGTPVDVSATYGPLSLDLDKDYFWRVDEVLQDSSVITGTDWTFTTLPSIPIVVTQPTDKLVDENQPAMFEVEVSSVSTPHYQWYYSPDMSTETTDDDQTVGTDSPVYSINQVSKNQQGYYYCSIINSSETPVKSALASLEVKQRMARYQFNDDLTDSENGFDGTAINPDPNTPLNYTDGYIDRALTVNGVDESTEIECMIRNSMTIAMWIRTSDTAPGGAWWQGKGLVDAEMPNNVNDFGTSLSGINGYFAFGLGNPETTVKSTTSINDGQWHYCVATRDHLTGTLRVYIDGLEEASVQGPTATRDVPTAIRIGAIQTGVRPVAADFDDIMIYNYPLDSMTIAQNYTGQTNSSICFDKPVYDFDNDCRVTINDFAMFAETWMECGIVPDCMP